jgi:hypothetical protein
MTFARAFSAATEKSKAAPFVSSSPPAFNFHEPTTNFSLGDCIDKTFGSERFTQTPSEPS